MKKLFTFLTAFALVMVCLAFSAEASPPNKSPAMNTQIVLVGDSGAGLTALSARVAAEMHGVQIVVLADGDGIVGNLPETPIIANKHGIVSIATVEQYLRNYREKTETPKSVSNFTKREFYDLPPNDCGFNGQSFANPIRAQTQNC